MIARYLDLSTGHLMLDTRQALSDSTEQDRLAHGWPAMTVAEYYEGWFITVPPFDDPEVLAQRSALPDDLYNVLTHAFNEGCQLVRFDADGDRLDGLPYYED
jgi:hypothetical protein